MEFSHNVLKEETEKKWKELHTFCKVNEGNILKRVLIAKFDDNNKLVTGKLDEFALKIKDLFRRVEALVEKSKGKGTTDDEVNKLLASLRLDLEGRLNKHDKDLENMR